MEKNKGVYIEVLKIISRNIGTKWKHQTCVYDVGLEL